MSSRDEPIRSEVFADFVKDTMAKKGWESHAGRNPGFYRYENTIRDVNLEAVLTRDSQSIPASQKLRQYVPCPLAHPGLCAEADADIHAVCYAIVKGLFEILKDCTTASFLVFDSGRRSARWRRCV